MINSRAKEFKEITDRLLTGCINSIDQHGNRTVSDEHGNLWLGTILYVMGELHRVRGMSLSDVQGLNFIQIARMVIKAGVFEGEIQKCFATMGMGMLNKNSTEHMVLGELSKDQRQVFYDNTKVVKSFDNNWEAFNGCIQAGRHILFNDPAENIVSHLEKIALKYADTGYFDDTLDRGNYNSYGLMSLNYSIRAVELLAEDHQVRIDIEKRFKPHFKTYFNLIKSIISPDGTGWVFGRSAGVLGQLQCIVLLEQMLSKGWLDKDDAAWARGASLAMTKKMVGLFWDDKYNWFSFNSSEHGCYSYRKSLPMAWDILRYFLQLEYYERLDQDKGDGAIKINFHQGECSKEIVTNRKKKCAIYIWSDGTDHITLPVMGGPGWVTGDAMARPYARGLFEWVTQAPVPVLSPYFIIKEQIVWPGWKAKNTSVEKIGNDDTYSVYYEGLVDRQGNKTEFNIELKVIFKFRSGAFTRHDILIINEDTRIDSYHMEILQPKARTGYKDAYGKIYDLRVEFKSDLKEIVLRSKIDIKNNSVYKNYYGHPAYVWRIHGDYMVLKPGEYNFYTTINWK